MKLIDADALAARWMDLGVHSDADFYSVDSIIRSIEEAPEVIDLRLGCWKQYDNTGTLTLECSHCGAKFEDYGDGIYTDTCPRCGAIMRGVEGDEDFAYDEFGEQVEEK